MISFDPLFNTLEEKGITLFELSAECGINTRTRAKFRKNENVSLETIVKICTYLDVPIESVVEVIRK